MIMNNSKNVETAIKFLKTNSYNLDFTILDKDELCEYEFEYLMHDACHDLTQALYELIPGCQVFVVRDYMDCPVHSAIYWPETNLTLDGNGFSNPEKLISDWSIRSVENCRGEIESIKIIQGLSYADEDAKENAMKAFEKILNIADLI